MTGNTHLLKAALVTAEVRHEKKNVYPFQHLRRFRSSRRVRLGERRELREVHAVAP